MHQHQIIKKMKSRKQHFYHELGLFHSFKEFNIGEDRSIYFANPHEIIVNTNEYILPVENLGDYQ